MADNDLDPNRLRQQIEAVDHDVVARLDERARLSKLLRASPGGESNAVDVEEPAWVETLLARSSGDFPEGSLRAILHQLRAAARSLQRPQVVTYLAPEGGFCHQASLGYFGQAEFIECPSVAEGLDAVVRGRANFAVFPFESSVDGLVQASLTALATTELMVVAERTRPATYHLMNRTGNLADLEKVYLAASTRMDCARFLERELVRVPLIDVRSPSVAAQFALDDHGGAAIVPEECGSVAALEVIKSNVGDRSDLRFRFGIAGLRPASRTGRDTTCLLLSVHEAPGSLFEVLKHFAERGISIKKLQSRPLQSGGWDSIFYVEVSGHVSDRPVVTALEAVRRATNYVRVIGSFPAE